MYRQVRRGFALLTLGTLGGLGVLPAALFAEGPATRPSSQEAAPTTRETAPSTRPAKPATRPTGNAKPSTKPATKPSRPLTLDKPAKPIPATPASVADLQTLEARVEAVSKAVMPAVVGVMVGSGQGSGVIISPDGYVLTAAHVSGEPNTEIALVLPDGRKVKAKTLGANKKIDSGLIKIDEPGPWPYCEIGKSADLAKGQWVVALGHPGGYRKDRPPVVRLGRILISGGPDDFIMTDCTLVGGDSGGPLFDLNGKVVGIHSRIGPSTLNNMHVPADTFTQTWSRLAAGDLWGDTFSFLTASGPMLGVVGETVQAGGARITNLTPKGPAADIGMKVGDVVTQFDGTAVKTIEDLAQMISKKKVGQEVVIKLTRGSEKKEFKVKLVRRPRD